MATTKSKPKPTRIDVTLERREQMTVPTRFRRAGYRPRWVKLGENPTDTESRIEAMEELGYAVVTDPDKGSPVTRGGGILMEVPEKIYQARQRAKVERNMMRNRAQAEENRRLIRSRLRQAAMDGKVLGEGRVEEPQEMLLDTPQTAAFEEGAPPE